MPKVRKAPRKSARPAFRPRGLEQDGFEVFRLFSPEQVKENDSSFVDAIREAPEFRADRDRSHPQADKYVGGGFAALGNPSSFHHPGIVWLRQYIYERVLGRLQSVLGGRKSACIIDRCLWRIPGESVTAEAFHRDTSLFTDDDDSIFGGWLSLAGVQSFRCVPGSHRTREGDLPREGFGVLSAGQKAHYRERTVTVDVPPGCVLVFYQNIVHTVSGGKAKEHVRRLFHGVQLTHSNRPVVRGLDKILAEQAVVPLKSGQVPPLYPKLWNVNWRDRRDEFCQRLFGRAMPQVHPPIDHKWPVFDTSIYFPH